MVDLRKLPWTHWLFSGFCIACGAAAFAWGSELIRANERATGVIVTVFSILAGFLVAVITLLGDQSTLPGGWRMAAAHKARIKAKMNRQKWLFCLYLITLAIIFASSLLNEKHHLPLIELLEKLYFGLATTAFLLSFSLPWTLMAIQVERLNAVIEARKSGASTIDRN